MKIKPGTVLVATPFHSEYLYRGSVILILDVSSKGPVGVILNKPTHAPICAVNHDIRSEEYVMMGGFTQPTTLSYLHRDPKVPNAMEISNGIYWGGRFDRIVNTANNPDTHFDVKFFAGYVSWSVDKLRGIDQLQNEISKGLWWTTDIDAATLFEVAEEVLWTDRCRASGSLYAMFDLVDHPSIN